ncbi:MAG TPA: phosphopentomutase [Candidatus Krumholzibacteria bacterium]|nr:phosphopentomutase [Candidatus Krumholzibacteria bacterium]
MRTFQRVVVIVLDGVGAGEAPDAAAYGDTGSHTLANTARLVGGLRVPQLARLGLGNIVAIEGVAPVDAPAAHFGRMRPAAAGKDSTTGHWEMMGCILDHPFPTYPHGFPDDVIGAVERVIGRAVIGNRVASGTEILVELGEHHLATGCPIVYTSADSVFQIAAHESIVTRAELYAWCERVRTLLAPPHGVGRVIARPFAGNPGGFYRTGGRRDFSLPPPAPTVLDALLAAGRRVFTIGKIDDLFAGRGVTRSMHTRDNREGMAATLAAVRARDEDLVFVNLVDFDSMWGHRNDARAFALGLEEFDGFLVPLLAALRPDDLLILTADHGNDPTTPSTDHSREYVPLLVYHAGLVLGRDLGIRASLADVGATVARALTGVAGACGTPIETL